MLRLAGHRSRPFDIRASRIAACTTAPTPFFVFRRSSSQSQSVHEATISAPSTSSAPPSALFTKIRTQLASLQSNGGGPSDSDVILFNETVSRLRESLEKNNICAAWQYWTLLDQRKLLHFLGLPHFNFISKAISCLYDTTPNYDETEVRALEEMALAAAAAQTADALAAVMAYHLKKNNSDAVLELNRKYIQLSKEKGNWKGEEDQSADADEGDEDAMNNSLALTSTRGPGHVYFQAVQVQLAVTTAYAMKNSFEGALEAFLSTNILTLTSFALNPFLKVLKHDPALLQKVKEYVQRLNTAKLIFRSKSFVKHIANLSRDESVERLQKLYSTVIDSISGPDAYLAALSSAVGSKKIVLFPEFAWTAFLRAFMKCQRVDLAEKVWDDVLRLGIRPDTSMWTALFDGYCGMGAVTHVLRGWDAMLSQGVVPNALTYRALISTLFNARRPDEAMTRFKKFEKLKHSPAWDPTQILLVYNTVLHGLFEATRENDAVAFFQGMKDNGPKPDIVSYNTVMQYYCRNGDFKAVATYVRDLSSCGLVADVFTFSIILSALLKVGREDAPEMMVNFMRKQGVEPNVATYSAIIHQQMREQSEDNLRAALRLLHRMEQDPRTPPNEVTYTTILAGLYRGRWLDPRVVEEYRQDIVERMKKRDIRPNRVTYNYLLKASLGYPEPEGLRSALGYHREMRERGLSLNRDNWYVLLHGLAGRGEWEMAGEMAREMLRSGFQPNR